jgi:hypothetical protein
LVLLETSTRAQDSQFLFDSTGDLAVQTAAINAPPQILSQPQNQIVAPSNSASFTVVVANLNNLTYQWRFNGTNLPSATSDSLLVTNVSVTNEGPYTVVLANNSGSITSAPAMLWIDSDGNHLPDSWEMTYFGGLLGQNSTADYDGDGVSNLQEFLDGTNPTNSASYSAKPFTLTILRDGGKVEASPSKLGYTNGEPVTLTAIAIPPEVFHGWMGDVISTSNTIVISMTTNKTVFAGFQSRSLVWTNAAGGNWNNPTNWSPNMVPMYMDDAAVSLAATISVDQPAECHDLVVPVGATLAVSNTLAIYGAATWNAGTLALAGTVNVSGGALWTGGTMTGTGTLTLNGNSTWSGGTMFGSGRTVVASNATLTITGTGGGLDTRTLENGGTIFWVGGGYMGLNNGAVFTNGPAGLFVVQNTLQISGIDGRFDNAGILRQSTPGLSLGSGFTFTNYGLVDIQTGNFILNAGGANLGTINISPAATLNIAGGTFISGPSASITGAGQLLFNGYATANLDGLVNVTGTNTFANAAVNLTGNYICTNTISIQGAGPVNFSGTGTVNPTVLTMTSGTLGGSQTVTIGNTMIWNGGSMNGPGRTVIPPGVTLIISSGGVGIDTRTLENQGTVALTAGAGSFGISGGAVFTNGPGALIDVQNSASMGGNPGRIDNAGTFRKSASPGTTTFSGALNNYGTLDLQTGTLLFNNGGSNSGNITLGTGTALNFGGGTFSSGSSSSIVGPAQLTVSGFATVNLGGLVNVSGTNIFGSTANLTGNYVATNNTLVIAGGFANFSGTGTVNPAVVVLSSGTLGGSQTVTVGNTMTWNGGNMNGSGRTVIPAGAMLNIPGTFLGIDTRTLENQGTVLYTAGSGSIGLSSGAVITNGAAALFHMQGATTISAGPGRFDNAGILRKSSSTGVGTIGVLNNYGTLDLRSGILLASGSYSCSPASTLRCVLGGTSAGSGYSQLQVSGTVSLNGILSTDLLPGFVPSTNNTFAVVSAGNRTRSFTAFLYPSNQVTMQLSNSPTAVLVRVTDYATNGPPLIVSDFPPLQVFYAGRAMILAATVAGGKPVTYQWKKDSTNLSDGGRINGSHSNLLTITNLSVADSGAFQLFATNADGFAQSALAAVTVQAVPKLNGTGAGWTLQGTTPPVMNSSNVTLTSGLGGTARTVFYNAPLYIAAFNVSFIYTDVNGAGADGVAFCLQNDARGASALGGGGGGLGYAGITPSAALAFNIYSPNTPGFSFRTNGTLPSPAYTPTTPVNVASGHPIFVSLVYTGGVLRTSLVESNTANTFTTNFAVNLPAILGTNIAYVGFTGGDGGIASTQVISNFTFVPLPTISADRTAPGLTTLSWPGTIGGYTAQVRSNLTVPADVWQTATNPINQANGRNQVLVPSSSGARFYRLSISPAQ